MGVIGEKEEGEREGEREVTGVPFEGRHGWNEQGMGG